ncbi:hypothetical protein GLAREA_03297 [Glarea lozoyensis ATCC 20868]|uniref:Uncharacterized protein n=1 Tax=Glarea lozoyensis (strain ATCC 20868 / MF5171) TaxID=1116229 RepID=S3CLM3_GLAL2|nr:uncharacterized protein GLAREA_03297 [Glarea lozoyensis ATCC 20868]EPE27382.1 hypothetical protein GLAREA_03297 [Glarea lozoyensis ATCC 20868]
MASSSTKLPNLASNDGSFHPSQSSRPSLKDFVLMQQASPGKQILMWNFPEQTWLIWNPKKLDKARADLWQGVHFILKALYFIKRSFSSRDIVRWAPDKFTKLVYSTDEWDAKLKLNLSLFHSQVLQRSLTYTILKRWRTFPSYPTRLDDRKGKVNVEVVRNRRKIWFRERSDLDREAFYCFTYFTSESVDWEQVYKRETTKDQRIYDWIISSMASAASIIFELGIDDQAEEDVKKSRRGKTERNEQWSNLAGEEAPPCEDLPLREIFGLGSSKHLTANHNSSLKSSNDDSHFMDSPKDVEDGMADSDNTSFQTQKRKRQPTQKAREASEMSRPKRSRRTSHSLTSATSPPGGVHKKAGSALADNVSEPEYPKRPDLKAESSKSSQEDMACDISPSIVFTAIYPMAELATAAAISTPSISHLHKRKPSSQSMDQSTSTSQGTQITFYFPSVTDPDVTSTNNEREESPPIINPDPPISKSLKRSHDGRFISTRSRKTRNATEHLTPMASRPSSPQSPISALPSHSSSPLSRPYSPPPRPSLTTETISHWDKLKAMEFLTRMQVPEDDVITMGKHTWPSGNGQPEMEFDGRTLLQLDREHVLDDKTILLEEPGRMWDVIRQAQNWAWRNDEVLERRAGEVGSVSGRPIEVVEDDDPVIFKTGRNGRGKRPVYEFRDDEGVVDLSDKGVVELSDDGQEGVVDLSDIEDEEGDANSPIVVDDKPQRRSERDSGHDITDLTVSSSDEMDDLYDA